MVDGQVVWAGVGGNAGAVPDRRVERAELQSKALDLLVCLRSDPHIWS